MFGSRFHESLQINVRVPDYFKKLATLMDVAKREYAIVVYRKCA